MNRNNELDVRDHLRALEHEEPWMEDLTGMIIEFTGADTAIAAGRAVDLCEDRRFGRAVSAMTQGFLRICRHGAGGAGSKLWFLSRYARARRPA